MALAVALPVVALAACGGSGDDGSASTGTGPAPLTLAERMVGAVDGLGDGSAPPPAPIDDTQLDLFFGPEARGRVLEGITTTDGGFLLVAASARDAADLLERFLVRARRFGATVVALPGVAGGRLVTTRL